MLSNATEIVRLIQLLRADEGDSVTLLCDNPDFNGQPNCAVVCNGDWTSGVRPSLCGRHDLWMPSAWPRPKKRCRRPARS